MVVSYRNSTSNHNEYLQPRRNLKLYLIEILHQTTTRRRSTKWARRLYLIEILHQTTTKVPKTLQYSRLYLIEILHQTTTFVLPMRRGTLLYLIEILHQTTTLFGENMFDLGCILSKFYIKPQLYGMS